MTNNNHPITPPPELVKEWATANGTVYKDLSVFCQNIATQAARWGADQELEACCEWVETYAEYGDVLRAARRPKLPSLKEQALLALDSFEGFTGSLEEVDIIRRAIESLPD